MRIVLFILLLSLLGNPAFAGKKASRKPSNRGPKKIITFVCQDNSSNEENAVGWLQMSRLSDNNPWTSTLFIGIKNNKDFEYKQTNGRVLFIKNNETIFQGFKPLLSGQEPLEIYLYPENYLDPGKPTILPGLPNQACTITGKLESN